MGDLLSFGFSLVGESGKLHGEFAITFLGTVSEATERAREFEGGSPGDFFGEPKASSSYCKTALMLAVVAGLGDWD